jgi:hypothetical protein
MAPSESSDAPASRNPAITMIEPATVTVASDYDVGGVALEVVDRGGSGFSMILDQLVVVLDVVLKMTGAVARLAMTPQAQGANQ